MDTTLARAAMQHNDKAVIYEHGAFILYKQGDVGYGALDWVYQGVISYEVGNEKDAKRAEKEAAEFLGVPNFWERFFGIGVQYRVKT